MRQRGGGLFAVLKYLQRKPSGVDWSNWKAGFDERRDSRWIKAGYYGR